MHKILYLPFLMALSATAVAGTPLNGDQVKQLISGNTVRLHSNVQGVDYNVYFAANGSATSHNESNSKNYKGTWRITDSGEHCSTWGNKEETCGIVMDMGDGTYNRMEGGAPRAIWSKVSPGNPLGL